MSTCALSKFAPIEIEQKEKYIIYNYRGYCGRAWRGMKGHETLLDHTSTQARAQTEYPRDHVLCARDLKTF